MLSDAVTASRCHSATLGVVQTAISTSTLQPIPTLDLRHNDVAAQYQSSSSPLASPPSLPVTLSSTPRTLPPESISELARRIEALEQQWSEGVSARWGTKKRQTAGPGGDSSGGGQDDQEGKRAVDERGRRTRNSTSATSQTVLPLSDSLTNKLLEQQVVAVQQQCDELSLQLSQSKEELRRAQQQHDSALEEIRSCSRRSRTSRHSWLSSATFSNRRQPRRQSHTPSTATMSYVCRESCNTRSSMHLGYNSNSMQHSAKCAQQHETVKVMNKEKQELDRSRERPGEGD